MRDGRWVGFRRAFNSARAAGAERDSVGRLGVRERLAKALARECARSPGAATPRPGMVSTVLHFPMPVLHFLTTVLNNPIPVLNLPMPPGGMATPSAGMATTVLKLLNP